MTVHFSSNLWDLFVGRLQGPMTLRFVLQPAMATFFAIRAGLKDAREGKAPYLWSAFYNVHEREELLRHGWKQVRMVFLMAFVLDTVYQAIVFRWIYLGQALVVAFVLAIVPYLFVRGPLNRVARHASPEQR